MINMMRWLEIARGLVERAVLAAQIKENNMSVIPKRKRGMQKLPQIRKTNISFETVSPSVSKEQLEKCSIDVLKARTDESIQSIIDVESKVPAQLIIDLESGPDTLPPLATSEIESEIKRFYQAHPELQETFVNPDAWINTFTGKKFYAQNPVPESICIEDIAHALSQQCRFTGHSSHFYSVAQHCILVSYFCHAPNALQGLLHDASEAYLSDISSPLKRLPELTGYRLLEKKVQQAIYRKWNLPVEEPQDVKYADTLILGIEAQSLLPAMHNDWKISLTIPSLKIDPLLPREAEQLFLDRFHMLTK
jgi:uncharacterized protein